MIKIIVVEDNKDTQMEIKMILRDTDVLKNEEIKIEYFNRFCPELKNIIKDTSERKIYILDIELGTKTSGIDIAKFIREVDWESEIIFLTSHDKMFETAYRNVHEIFDFIEKFHNMKERLKKDIKAIFKRNHDKKMFKFSCRNFNLQIYYRSITYIYRDKEERKLVINTDNNNYSVYLTVSECLNYLDNRFKSIHRACIVNLDRVESFNWSEGYFVLDTGEKVYMLSKKFKKELEDLDGKNI